MALPKEGYELLQCTVAQEAVRWVKIQAAVEGLAPGRIVERALRTAMEGSDVLNLLPGMRYGTRHPDAVPAASTASDAFHRMREAKRPPAKAPRKAQDGGEAPGGGGMTWSDLVAALEAKGKTHRQLREFLGLSNISVWAKEGVPAKHVPRIKEFLAQNTL